MLEKKKRSNIASLIISLGKSIEECESVYNAYFSIPKSKQTRAARAYMSDMAVKKDKRYQKLIKEIVPILKERNTYKQISVILNIPLHKVIRDGRYGGEFWGSTKEEVRRRDKNTCQKCKTKRANMHVHHIGDPQNNDLDNLILLCASCHSKGHKKLSTSGLANLKEVR